MQIINCVFSVAGCERCGSQGHRQGKPAYKETNVSQPGCCTETLRPKQDRAADGDVRPAADAADVFPATDADVPSTSDADVPSASGTDVPSASGADVPSTSGADVPSASDADVSSASGADIL